MEQNDAARSAAVLLRHVTIELERSDQHVDVWHSNVFNERGPKHHTGSIETHAEVKHLSDWHLARVANKSILIALISVF